MMLVDLWFYGMMIGFIAALIFQSLLLIARDVDYCDYWPVWFDRTLFYSLAVITYGSAGVSLTAYLALLLGASQ